jgi:hypothetical protein
MKELYTPFTIKPFEYYKKCTYPGVKEDLYIISDEGNIINTKTNKTRKTNILDKNGYPRLEMACKEKGRHIQLHILVAHEFIGIRPEGLVINHKDGDPTRSFAENLEYITQSENVKHAYRIGLATPLAGENANGNVYKESMIREICKMFQDGIDIKDIRKTFGASRTNNRSTYSLIDDIRAKRTWKYVIQDYDY